MTARTPLELLDEAVHAYIAATTDEDETRAVAGWALGIETTAINSDPDDLPLMDAQHYVSGPQTTSSQALGLGRYVASVYETHITRLSLGLDKDDD